MAAKAFPIPNDQVNRILLIVTRLSMGGAQTQVVRLAKELKERGWAVGVVCMIKPALWVQELNQDGIEVFSLGMLRGVPDPRAIFRLRRLILDFKPNVVHSHTVHANLLARVTRLFCPMPVLICTAHSPRETSENGGPTWHTELLYSMTDFLADRTTIICKAAFDRYVQAGVVPPDKFEIVPNGVDVHRFSPSANARQAARRELGLSDQTFAWLAVGRLVEQKDYMTLLQSIDLLPDWDFVVLIAGDGPLLEPLKAEAYKRRLDDKVWFVGAHEHILKLYAAADAFVMSSVLEGLPAALLEAASMGLPAVVTGVGGTTEIVLDGETGYVVPPSQPLRLSDAMEMMMMLTPEVLASFGAAARTHCVNGFRFELVADQWIELYRRCQSRIQDEQHQNTGFVVGPVAH